MKIIAEVGSNFKTIEDCLNSIKIAKECGSDVCKFQLFTPHDMYGSGDLLSSYYGKSPYLHPDWIPSISAKCLEVGIELMITAFSSAGYQHVDNFVRTHKIASGEITDLDILAKVNSFKKRVYLSTGGASMSQVAKALSRLKDCPVTIMYCVTAYPARVVDFRHLEELRDNFGSNYLYGYSDHSTDVLNIPLSAVKHGCSVIEKHVNFTSHTDTDDAPHSLSTDEFKLMVKSIRGDEITLQETFTPCTWQRQLIGDNYFRPRGNEADV